MIPEAAVEAAARAMSPAAWGPRVWTFMAHGETPTAARDRVQRESLATARATLEAAAPQMLANAWAQGAVAGWKQSGEGFNAECPDESTGGCSVDLSGNPFATEPNFGCPDCGDKDWACDCRWKGSL